MTWGGLAASALTAVLTLTGGLVLLQFQTITKAAEERRAARRQWHDEAVDVIIDVAGLIIDSGLLALGLPADGEVGRSADPDNEWRSLQERWRTTLLRRVQRISRGHPDSRMRAQAGRIADASVRALQVAFGNVGEPHRFDNDEIIRIFDSELIPIVRSYVRCLHGEDKNAEEDSVSTLLRIYEMYRVTGMFVKPGEISP